MKMVDLMDKRLTFLPFVLEFSSLLRMRITEWRQSTRKVKIVRSNTRCANTETRKEEEREEKELEEEEARDAKLLIAVFVRRVKDKPSSKGSTRGRPVKGAKKVSKNQKNQHLYVFKSVVIEKF